MQDDHPVTPPKATSREAKLLIALAVALASYAWWLLSDREPMQKEMTFAYRKHIVALNEDRDIKDLADIRQRLHVIELVKQHCVALGGKRYRCQASVLVDGHPVDDHPAAGNAVYSRDAKGWRFEAIGEE